jgi:hypothetical protein
MLWKYGKTQISGNDSKKGNYNREKGNPTTIVFVIMSSCLLIKIRILNYIENYNFTYTNFKVFLAVYVAEEPTIIS